jgi:two-component system LytT family sensor kinase
MLPSISGQRKRIRTIFWHISIWMLAFGLPYLLDDHDPRRRIITSQEETAFFYLRLFTYGFWVAVFYLNSNLFTKHFIYRRKYISYTLLLLAIFAIVLFFHGLAFQSILTCDYTLLRAVRFNFPTFVLTIAISTIYRMSKDQSQAEKHIQETRQENMRTELSFLRSQISPHFLFNVLNNIVAMVRLKSEGLEDTVIKLSSLMQYMLYETDGEKVLLKTEAEYLQSYIDLQQQRFGGKVKIETHFELSNDWDEIEPMLLIPFVENAFKHGVGLIHDPQIHIRLETRDKVLRFSVRNKYNRDSFESKDKISGIGLANVTRRLNLLYERNHGLDIRQEGLWFEVSLTLNLHV